MIKKIKYFATIFLLIFLSSCSFDNKTGIWSGNKEEKERLAELERLRKEEEARRHAAAIKIQRRGRVYLKQKAESGKGKKKGKKGKKGKKKKK